MPPPWSPSRSTVESQIPKASGLKSMYVHNRTGTPAPQGYAPNAAAYGSASGYGSNPAFVPPPGFITTTVSSPALAPALAQAPTPRHTPTPPAPALTPVQVPAGCYPIELVQFWREEYKRTQPFPLHWALFVRTAPPSSPRGSMTARTKAGRSQTPRGNFYELVGSPDTYTAQFLAGVTFSPESLPDWRGTHVIGWVHPSQLGVFERVVRQVPVWRRRPDWRCQQWVYDVVCALAGRYEGVFVEGCTFGVMQRQMGWLLEAWENGDI